MKTKRRILALFADTHGGHKLGLLNPATVLHDEAEDGTLVPYTPQLTQVQYYLWSLYEQHLEQTFDLAGKSEIVVIHNGDIGQGDKYVEHLVSTRKADQLDIAYYNMKPWLESKNVKTMRLAKGTGAHVFSEGSLTITAARLLQAQYPKKNIKPLYHGLADIDGVEVDYAHHGPYPGNRRWLKGNVARYYLRDLMEDEIASRGRVPDLVVRAHYHEIVTESLTIRSNGNCYTSHLIVLPSYCGLGDHAHRATRSTHKVTNGMAAYEIVDGELNPKPYEFTETVDLRTKEVL